MKRLFLVMMMGLILAGISVVGCAGELVSSVKSRVPAGDAALVLADKLLGRTFQMYQDYIQGTFDPNIAMDAPSRDELIDLVGRSQRAGKVLELNYFMDSAVMDAAGKALAVSFKWEKRTQPKGKREAVLAKGKASIIYKKQVNGDWLIYQVTGDNPF